MRVKLAAAANPDFGTSVVQGILSLPARWAEVSSLRDASQVCQRYIAANELGGGNWAGGDVEDDTGQVVAYISYNGRVWESRAFPANEIPI